MTILHFSAIMLFKGDNYENKVLADEFSICNDIRKKEGVSPWISILKHLN